MSRTLSVVESSLIDPSEPIESVLQRCPSGNLETPAPNKPVAIRPLKRDRGEGEENDDAKLPSSPPELELNGDEEDSPTKHARLSPRRLDMNQRVSFTGVDSDDDGVIETTQRVVEASDGGVIESTQRVVEASDGEEEGELPPVLERS